MIRTLLLRLVVPLALAAVAFGCTQKNTADEPQATGIPSGLERFLLFPNPIAQSTGGFETDTTAYAQAYYRAIDPADAKDTLEKWKTANLFGDVTGTEHRAVFRDVKDLGYGRNMTGRMNADGSVAFFVENYNVTNVAGGGYSTLNVEAAIARDARWHVGTNAIEWSTSPCVAGVDPADCVGNSNGVRFAKYYNFSPADGTRQLAVDLDGKGMKAMPGPCITCHGGRGDPLTPPDAGNSLPRFPLVENSVSRKRGDVQARLHGMNVDSFDFSPSAAGFTKPEQQAKLKDFNQWILCTYPTATPASVTGSWGSCNRPTAGANEWQGTAAALIEAWYGGPGMPLASFRDTYVPAGWVGNPTLYTNVVAPYCRTCHILRGTANQNDIDFTALGTATTGFQSYADRTKAHVFDRGNMPLALIVYDDFWKSSAPQTLANYIDSVLGAGTATSAGGAALKPGRPIADPGPDRMVRTGANAVLTAENSLFASTFSWSVISGSATITNANGMIAIFRANSPGTYVVRLTVGNGASANSKDVTITVDDAFPDPLNIRFAHVKDVLQNVVHATAQKCTACHVTTAVSPVPPIFYNTFDRDGSGVVDPTDDAWFLKALSGRVNLTEIGASPLLRKSSGNHHNGGQLFNLATSAGLRSYSIFYNWILAGMQPGGVAASPIVNGGVTPVALTFGGSPPFATGIALDGGASIGATSFLWSVVGPSGPTGELPFVSNPTSASAAASPTTPPTLNLPYVGTYVVQLLVSDGASSDAASRSITVSETTVATDFLPATGNATVSFSGTPIRGNINLTSTSTGSPAICQWRVSGPAGATLDGSSTLDTTKSCGSPATLNVPLSSVGGAYSVTLTATSSLETSFSSVNHVLTVQSAGSGVVANAGANSTNTVTFTNPLSSTPPLGVAAPDQAGIPGATVALNGSASVGPGTLTYAWSVTGQPGNATGAYAPTISSANSVSATLNVRRAGAYTVSLFVSNGLPPGPSNTATRTITVNANAITFTTMKSRFGTLGCTSAGCHVSGSTFPPSWIDETVGGLTLYQRVSLRVNSADPAQSLMVRCPAQGDCGMGQQTGFLNSNLTNYNEFLNWIMSGAPNN